MDEWNRYPNHMNDDEPNPPSAAPTEPSQQPPTAPQEPQAPATPPYTPPQQQTPPAYNPYGWSASPYQMPTPPPKPPKNKKGGAVIGIVGGLCALVIVVLSVMLAIAYQNEGGTNNTGNSPNGGTSADAPALEITELDENTQGLSAREIVKQNADSAVLLTIYENQTSTNLGGFPFSQGNTTSQEVKAGSASGIIMTADGYIITNWHCVVDDQTDQEFPRIDVTLYNGTVYERAEIIGYDSSTDLAVIKVPATDLQPAVFGDSSALQLGDRVVALGNAGGLGWSATQGIVSGLARDVYEDTGYAIKCLQVDAAINPGNSGGPLFNAAGQVVAVNSAKIAAEEYEGIGFSIPINEAKKVIDNLISVGYVTGRVSLGITGQTYADAYYNGFLVYSVDETAPAASSGLQQGDLITKVDGQVVTDYAELRAELAKHQAGDEVTLTVLRSANRQVTSHEIRVTLQEAKG